MEESTLERALKDIKVIRASFEIAELLAEDKVAMDAQASITQEARESLLKHLDASVSLLPEKLDEVFKRSAMLLISPGVRRGFIDSLMKVNVMCNMARSTETEKPERTLYIYNFSREVDYFNISQMCGEQLYMLFLADLIENASNVVNYQTMLDFDRTVTEKCTALLYAIKVARRVFDTEEWPSAGDDERPPPGDGPASGGGRPDPGGSGVPRVPLTPTLVGAAANEIPSDDELDVEWNSTPLFERIRV